MQFNWIYSEKLEKSVKEFLIELKIPRTFVTHVKQYGDIQINGQHVTVREHLTYGDQLSLLAPNEVGHDTVKVSDGSVEVIYEDQDVLVVNKPANLVSIPSKKDPNSSMANRVKGYYVRTNAPNQVIHIVTRLDRDTTGLMLIAKHRLAHALLDQQHQSGDIHKYYWAISSKMDWVNHGIIDQPIARHDHSIITRTVHHSGQRAITEFWLGEKYSDSSLIKLKLHTGRTHQIRVHLANEGGVLIGDDLYGGRLEAPLFRQALHCGEVRFIHPITKKIIKITQELPADMQEWIDQRKV